ncbi:MAG: ceramidase domain-containing protein [Paracoccaceae bacterium]
MDWVQTVDIYCERTSTAYWAEPVNALTNAAFLLAALWGAVEARRRGTADPLTWLLIGMAALIGVGSFLFHTHATRWSELADTLPIWSFVAVFVLTAMRRIGGMPAAKVARVAGLVIAGAVLTLVFLASGEGADAARTAPDPLNGSGQYAPALLALVVFSGLSWWRDHRAAPWVAAATGVFVVSLVFRTLDRDICATLPLGTHFLWHLLNGLMIGLLLQMLVRAGQPAPQPR